LLTAGIDTAKTGAISVIEFIRPGRVLTAYESCIGNKYQFFKAPMPFSGIGSLTALETAMMVAFTRMTQPARIFEFGTYLGHTSATFALNSLPNTEVVTIDLFEATKTELETDTLKLDQGDENDEFLRRVAASKETPWLNALSDEIRLKIRQLHGNSCDLDVEALGLSGSVDLIFVDGGHDTKTITNDTEKAFEMASDDAVILWHDFGCKVHTDVSGYLDELGQRIDLVSIGSTMLAAHLKGRHRDLFQ